MCEGLLIGSLGVEFQLSYPRLISAPLVSTPLASTRLVSIQLVSAHESKTYWKLGVHSGVSQGNSSCMALALKSSYAIEPTKHSFNKLLKNIELNPSIKNQITPIQAFITSKESKPDTVYTSWELNSEEKKHSQHLGVKKSLEDCILIALDQLVEKNKIKKSIIKCDVDGNELFVFESGINFLRKFKPIIIMELAPYLYPESGYKSSDLFNFFKKYGYKYFEVHTKKEIHNIQDFSDAIPAGSSKNIFLI